MFSDVLDQLAQFVVLVSSSHQNPIHINDNSWNSVTIHKDNTILEEYFPEENFDYFLSKFSWFSLGKFTNTNCMVQYII